MGNEPHTFKVGKIEARHVPEPDATFDPSAHDVAEPVTGFVDIGVTVDGVFVPLLRRKASGLVADINRVPPAEPEPDSPSE
jgi:hypothetical protein